MKHFVTRSIAALLLATSMAVAPAFAQRGRDHNQPPLPATNSSRRRRTHNGIAATVLRLAGTAASGRRASVIYVGMGVMRTTTIQLQA